MSSPKELICERPALFFTFAALAALLLIAATFGVDPHHDWYGVGPGFFASLGLVPHRDFYTHYGAFDATLKALVLHGTGMTLLGMRAGFLAIQIGGVSVAAITIIKLARSTRDVYLWLIAAWMAWSVQAGHEWGMLVWSSDICGALLNCLIATLAIEFCIYGGKETFSKKQRAKIKALNFAQGCLLALTVLAKVTIGIAGIAGVVISRLFVRLLIRKRQGGKGYSEGWLNMTGGFIAVFAAFGMMISGEGGLRYWFIDIFMSKPLGDTPTNVGDLLEMLSTMLTSEAFQRGYVVTAISIATGSARKDYVLGARIGLISIVALTLYEWVRSSRIVSPIETVHHVGILVGAILGITGLAHAWRSRSDEPDRRWCLVAATYPIGVASLLQIYPLDDVHHTWYALTSALPMMAVVISGSSKARVTRDKENEGIIRALALFGFFLALINTTRMIDRHRYQITDHRGTGFYKGIKTREPVTLMEKEVSVDCVEGSSINTRLVLPIRLTDYSTGYIFSSDRKTLRDLVRCSRGLTGHQRKQPMEVPLRSLN